MGVIETISGGFVLKVLVFAETHPNGKTELNGVELFSRGILAYSYG